MLNRNLLVSADKYQALTEESFSLPFWQLTERQLCDLELFLNGAFAPLDNYLAKPDYEAMLSTMRLADGTLCPIPLTLDLPAHFAESLSSGDKITLRDQEHFALAMLTVENVWEPDLRAEAEAVYRTLDDRHPGVAHLLHATHPCYISGKLQGFALPHYIDYRQYRLTPAETRARFKQRNWERIIAFQTRNPMHRAHIELTRQAMRQCDAKLLIHPVVGVTQPGDINYHTRIQCYKAALAEYAQSDVMLSVLPLAMRMGGPREALWHALIRKNYGCTQMIVGRDHAGPGADRCGRPFYKPFEAHELLEKHTQEIGIEPVMLKEIVYDHKRRKYVLFDEVKNKDEVRKISGTEMRNMLGKGEELPDWFTLPEVAKALYHTYPPLWKRGFTVFFTGLSGAGKTTLAKLLMIKLLEHGRRRVTLLDGDIVRTHLSRELGFSKEHRSINVRRIGFVASEITKNGGIAVCAPIAPYTADRKANRELISKAGMYIEVYVSTPLAVCEHRDVKGFYMRARHNLTKDFTGINDPYEVPENPEITVDSSDIPPEDLIDEIYRKIEEMGCL